MLYAEKMFPGVNRGCPLAASRLDFGQAPCGGVLSTLGSGSQRVRSLGGLLSRIIIINIIMTVIIMALKILLPLKPKISLGETDAVKHWF
jgi:hypothetical protein